MANTKPSNASLTVIENVSLTSAFESDTKISNSYLLSWLESFGISKSGLVRKNN